MGIMDMIRKWNENKKIKSEKFQEMQENYKMNKMLEERQKSANERELERYMEEQREKMIKDKLGKIRKKENTESWKSNYFKGGTAITKNDRPILKEKNIFTDNRNDIPLTKSQPMFFRW